MRSGRVRPPRPPLTALHGRVAAVRHPGLAAQTERRPAPVPVGRLLVGVRHAQEAYPRSPVAPDELDPDGEPSGRRSRKGRSGPARPDSSAARCSFAGTAAPAGVRTGPSGAPSGRARGGQEIAARANSSAEQRARSRRRRCGGRRRSRRPTSGQAGLQTLPHLGNQVPARRSTRNCRYSVAASERMRRGSRRPPPTIPEPPRPPARARSARAGRAPPRRRRRWARAIPENPRGTPARSPRPGPGQSPGRSPARAHPPTSGRAGRGQPGPGRRSAASSAERVIGPTWSRSRGQGDDSAERDAPYVGMSPVTPDQCAGPRMEPPVSLPEGPGSQARRPAPRPPPCWSRR